jgi:tetratricopeptide (TPR) repeat protein
MKGRYFSHILNIATSLAMITAMFFVIPHAGATFKYIKKGMEVPDITLKTLKGDEVNLAGLKGSPASIIVFWSTWSARSISALKEVQKIAGEYGEKGLNVLTINVDSPNMKYQDTQDVTKVKDDLKLSLKVAVDDGYQAYNTFGVVATPSFAVLDSNGTIVHEAASFRKATADELRAEVEVLLGLRERAEEDAVVETAYKPERKSLLYYNLSRNLLAQGNHEKAIRKLEDSVEADLKFPAPRVLLGHLLMNERTEDNFARAEELFREAIAADPENVSALTGLGEVLLEKDSIDEALEVLTKAVALNETYTPAVVNMAFALARQGKADEAKDRFDEAVELNPLDANIYQRRGRSAELEGNMSAAAEDYRKAVEILLGSL